MEDSTCEAEERNAEMESLKEQLATYQALNVELSKKVQEFKFIVSATNKELVATRNELMSEKLKTSEFRRTILAVNSQACHFVNSYIHSVQRLAQQTNLDLTMPDINLRGSWSPATIPADVQEPTTSQQPMRKYQQPSDYTDMNPDNILNTICETSHEETTSNSPFVHLELNAASTPFQRSVPTFPTSQMFKKSSRAIELLSELAEVADAQENDSHHRISDQTPHRPLGLAPKRKLPDEGSYMEEDSASVIEDSTKETVDQAEETEDPAEEMEDPAREIQEPADETEDPVEEAEDPVEETEAIERTKNCRVEVLRMNLEEKMVKSYVAKYLESSEADSDSGETQGEASGMETDETVDSRSSTKKTSRGLKRKRKSLPRRSTGRPKRKARLVVGSLAEKSLGKKLRRSK